MRPEPGAAAHVRGVRVRQFGAHTWLDTQRGFFNGTSLFLRVHGQESAVHSLELVPPRSVAHWEAATALLPHKSGKRGFGTYLAADYDELVDCPVEMGPLWSAEFRAGGETFARLNFGCPREILSQALDRIATALTSSCDP